MGMFDQVKVFVKEYGIQEGIYQIKTFNPPQMDMYYLGDRGGMAYLCKDEELKEVYAYNGDMLLVGDKWYTLHFDGGMLDGFHEVEMK